MYNAKLKTHIPLLQEALLVAIVVISPLIEWEASYLLLTLARLLLLAILALWAWNCLASGHIAIRKTAIDIPMALFVLISLATTVFISPYKHVSIQWMLNIIGYGVLFYATVLFAAEGAEKRLRMFRAIMLVGFLEALTGVVQHFYLGGGRVQGTFSNPNYFAGYLAVVSALAAAAAVSGVSKREQLLSGVALFAMLTGILLSGSRGGFLAAVAALTVVFWSRFRKHALYFIVIITLLAIIIPNPLLQRVKELSHSDVYAYSRISMWKGAMMMMQDHPIGTGLGIYEYVSKQYSLPNKAAIAHYGKFAETAHNNYLQVGVELGFTGLIIFLFGMAMLTKEAMLAIKTALSQGETRLAVGLVGGIVSVFTHGLVDFNLQSPAIAMLLVICGGLLVAVRQANQKIFDKTQLRFTPTIFHYGSLLLLAVIATIFVGKSAFAYYISLYGDDLRKKGAYEAAVSAYKCTLLLDSGATRYPKGLANIYYAKFKATEDVRWADAALRELDHAETLNPLSHNFPLDKALIYRGMAGKALTVEFKQKLLREALNNFEKVITLDPYNPFHYHRAGKILLSEGNHEAALTKFMHVKEMEPNFLPSRLDLARIYRMMFQVDAARKEYNDILEIKSRFRNVKQTEKDMLYLDVDEGFVRNQLLSLPGAISDTSSEIEG